MESLSNFHMLLGELVMFCQCIENDIKCIYAGMLKGDFDQNYRKVENSPLGPVLDKLEFLDNSDDRPSFCKEDYDLLNEIREIRNYWVHKSYTDFVYKKGNDYHKSYFDIKQDLVEDNKRLNNLSKQTESIRLDVLHRFNRI